MARAQKLSTPRNTQPPLCNFHIVFGSFSPIIFLMPDANDRHRVYMYFQDCGGWQCQFLEADLQTSLRRQLHFASSDKLVEFVERGGGFKDQEARMMLDQGTEKGRGGVFLSLTDEQYAELNR
jgi:hypothetical protein